MDYTLYFLSRSRYLKQQQNNEQTILYFVILLLFCIVYCLVYKLWPTWLQQLIIKSSSTPTF